MKLFGRKKKQVCVVGLDGVPCTLLQTMMETGVMPRTREIVSRGVLRSMTVTLPEISSVSWSTFMTGKNPGEHGIFGFTDLKKGTYDLRFPTFRDLRAETIWDLVGRSGGRSVVVNQPSTYPAREIPGVLISGFVSVDIDKSVQPKKHLAMLARHGYRVDVDTDKCRDNPTLLFSQLASLLDARLRVVNELWSGESWTFMEVVVTGTDRLHHFAWDAYEDPSHPHHGDFLDYYAKVDAFIGQLYDKFAREDSPENFFLLSDHGFCRTKKEFYVNTVLEQHGYLKLDPTSSATGTSPASSPSLANIMADSKAFALDPARIYIHRRDRYPRGSVDEKDAARLKREIAEAFESAADANGEKIVRRVFDAADVYSGPHALEGPDLLLIPYNGYDMKGKLGASSAVGDRRLQGMHTWDNAFFFSMRKDLVDPQKEIEIAEVPWIILRSIDVGP
jgi:predicted AlkP superfamily phosphohydrolase/phosphomutase